MTDGAFPAGGELELVRRAQSGDRPAFQELYRQHIGHVYAVCLRMLADPTQANEVTQEIIIHVWQTLPSFRGESPFSAWIHRISVRAVLDHLRSARRLASRVRFSDDLESFEREERWTPPEAGIDLEGAIALLPPQARSVLAGVEMSLVPLYLTWAQGLTGPDRARALATARACADRARSWGGTPATVPAQ